MKAPNRFDDLTVGDRVKSRYSFSHAPFSGEAEVVAINGDKIDVETRPVGYCRKSEKFTVSRDTVTFACHHEGAPFTSYDGGRTEGYADGFQTGWTWPRDHWNHEPGGPYKASDCRHRSDGCRHYKAYAKATEEHYRQWHRGFKIGEQLRQAAREQPIDWQKPLELDTGEPVELMQIDEHLVFVKVLEDHRWKSDLRKGVTISARRSGMLVCDHARYVRNRNMSIAKRSGFIILSTERSVARFHLTLEEASRDYHRSRVGPSFIICSCEQQAESEGGIFQTVSIGGPVQPLPKEEPKSYSWYLAKGPRISDWVWMSNRESPPPSFRGNLKLTFQGDKLLSAEVIS